MQPPNFEAQEFLFSVVHCLDGLITQVVSLSLACTLEDVRETRRRCYPTKSVLGPTHQPPTKESRLFLSRSSRIRPRVELF